MTGPEQSLRRDILLLWNSRFSARLARLKRSPSKRRFGIYRGYGRCTASVGGRKLKGIALIRLPNGKIRMAELHWYEALGRREIRWKRYLD